MLWFSSNDYCYYDHGYLPSITVFLASNHNQEHRFNQTTSSFGFLSIKTIIFFTE